MNIAALLKTAALVGVIGLYQGYDHYRFLLAVPLTFSPEQQKARSFEMCVRQRIAPDAAKFPDLWTRKREVEAKADCHAQVYDGVVWRLDRAKPQTGRFKLDGAWHYENGQAMTQSREQCLAQLEQDRTHNRHGLDPAYEARAKARCNELYTGAQDKAQ